MSTQMNDSFAIVATEIDDRFRRIEKRIAALESPTPAPSAKQAQEVWVWCVPSGLPVNETHISTVPPLEQPRWGPGLSGYRRFTLAE